MKSLVAAVAACALVTPASASAPSDLDHGCELLPAVPGTAYVTGGPILQNGTITCTIQDRWRHDDPDGFTVSATGTNGVTYLQPTLVPYAGAGYLCTKFTDSAGVAWIYDDVDGTWEAAAGNATAGCALNVN